MSLIVLEPCLLFWLNQSTSCSSTNTHGSSVSEHRWYRNCATDQLFKWHVASTTHWSNELNSGEKTLILSWGTDCKSVKTFHTVISWQTTNTGYSLTIYSVWLFVFKVFLQFQLMPWPQRLCSSSSVLNFLCCTACPDVCCNASESQLYEPSLSQTRMEKVCLFN